MNSNIQLPSNFRNIFYFALFIPLMVNAQGTYNHLEKIEYVCEKETVYGSLRSNQNFDFKSLERDIHKYSVKERTSQNPLWRDCPAFILPNDLFGFFWWFYKTPNNKTLGNMERLDNTITISNSLYNLFDLWRHSHKIVGNSCKDYFEFKKDQKKIQICSNGYVKVFSYWNTYWYPFHSSWWDFKVTRNIDIYAISKPLKISPLPELGIDGGVNNDLDKFKVALEDNKLGQNILVVTNNAGRAETIHLLMNKISIPSVVVSTFKEFETNSKTSLFILTSLLTWIIMVLCILKSFNSNKATVIM